MNQTITIKIGDIIELNFKKLKDAKNFAVGYNRGRKMKDFDYDEFDSEMEQRGFDFSFKVWSMLRIHAEEEKFRKSKAVIIGYSPRWLKSQEAHKILSET